MDVQIPNNNCLLEGKTSTDDAIESMSLGLKVNTKDQSGVDEVQDIEMQEKGD